MSSTTSQSNYIKVYLKNVSRSSFSSTTDYESLEGADIVYQGTFTFNPGWNMITLNAPFEYDGTSNLMVAIHESTPDWSTRNFYATEATGSVISFHSDSSNPDPYNLSSFQGTKSLYNYRANIRIGIIPNTVVQIGEGSNTSSYLPSSSYYNYSMTEQIYTAEEIDHAGMISSLSFYNEGGEHTRNYNIYMLHTDKTAFESGSDAVPVSAADLVFSGLVQMTANQWTKIVLTNPFTYNGTDNLMLVVDDNTGVYTVSNRINCQVFPTTTDQALRFCSDGTDFDPTNPGSSTGTTMSSKNKIKLGYVSAGQITTFNNTVTNNFVPIHGYNADAYLKCEFVMKASELTELSYSNITGMTFYANDENISWGNANFKVFLKVVDGTTLNDFTGTGGATTVYEGPLSIVDGKMEVTFNNPYTYGGGNLLVGIYNTVKGSYKNCQWVGSTVNGASVQGYSTSSLDNISATQRNFVPKTTFKYQRKLIDPLWPITDGSAGNTNLPSHSYFKYSLSEQIYTPVEIGKTGNLYYIYFYNSGETKTRNYDIYLRNTTKTSFNNATDWISVTAQDLVFSGEVELMGGTWTMVEFNTPFSYNGTYNLALVVDDNTGSYSSGLNCLVLPTSTNQAIYVHSDATNYDPTAPSSYNGTLLNEKNQLMLSFTPGIPTMPGSLQAYSITPHSAVLYWSQLGEAAAWQICLNNDEGHLINAESKPFTLTGLTPETTYTVKVRAVGNGIYGTSIWSNKITFTTLPGCTDPSGLTVSDISQTSATLNWTENGSASTWQIRLNDDEGNTYTVYSTTRTLTGLTPGTTYTAKVRANCGGITGYSEWSDPVSFTTYPTNPEPIIQIGEGDNTSNFLPTNTLYNYSLTQQLYTGAEIGQSGPIYSIAFYNTSDATTRNLNIYMAHTNKTSFSGNTDWSTVTSNDLVYSGTVTFQNGQWTRITLTTPFNYNSSENLLLVVDDNTGSWVSTKQFLAFDAPQQAIRIFNDNTNYDPSDPSEYYGYELNVKNQILFDFIQISCPTPTSLTTSNITTNSAKLGWTGTDGASSWQICIDGQESNPINVTTNPFTFTNLTPNTTYTVKVRTDCGGLYGVSAWSNEISFTTLPNIVPAYATITGENALCPGQTTTLTANTDVPATYMWNTGATTQNITAGPGTYTVTVTSSTGNETASEPFTITENQSYEVTDTHSICPDGLPHTWNGVTFNAAGTQTVTLTTSHGCDSVVTMTLIVNQTYNTPITASICQGESYSFFGQALTEAGDYTHTLQTVNGCDSVITLSLTVNETSNTEITIETSDSCYAWNGNSYCLSGDYTVTLQNVNGCDSVVTLHLTITVGIEDYDLTNVHIAPNPTRDVCRIIGLETAPVSVDLFDINGKLVLRSKSTEFDVSSLRAGMYTVRVTTDEKVVNLKLIRQ